MQRLAVIALVGVLLVGCGDDDDSPSGSTRAPTSSTTAAPSTTPTLESEVEAAYLAYWEMTVRLQQAPDPDDPEIRQRAVGRAADALVDGLTTLRAQRRIVRFGPRYAHDVISVEVTDRGAVVRDCFVDDATTIDASTGERVSGGVASGVFAAILRDVDGEWLVSELEVEEAQEGAGGCVDSSQP